MDGAGGSGVKNGGGFGIDFDAQDIGVGNDVERLPVAHVGWELAVELMFAIGEIEMPDAALDFGPADQAIEIGNWGIEEEGLFEAVVCVWSVGDLDGKGIEEATGKGAEAELAHTIFEKDERLGSSGVRAQLKRLLLMVGFDKGVRGDRGESTGEAFRVAVFIGAACKETNC